MKRRTFQSQAETLQRALERELPTDANMATALIQRGAVYASGKRVQDPTLKLKPGTTLAVVLEEQGQSVLEGPPKDRPEPRVLYEDTSLLVVDKPPRWDAQPTPGKVGDSLADWVERHLAKPPGLIHRLDRETSGVVVFGKDARATAALARAFREGDAHKRYLAACGPNLPVSGDVDLPLSKDPTRPGRYRATREAHGVPARTLFERLHHEDAFALVALYPQTGRTHQLRAHLTALGCPIMGDRRYGGAPTAGGLTAERCLLHAHALELPHPRQGHPVRFESPVPADLSRFFDRAGVPCPTGPIKV